MNNLRGVIVHDADDLKDELSPQEREKAIRRLGTTWLFIAAAGIAVAAIVTLATAVVAGDALDTANGRLFLTISSVFSASIFAALLGAALVEWIQRPQRTQIRQAAAVARGNAELGAENARLAAENAILIDKYGQLVYRLVDAVDALQRDVGGRLDRIEDDLIGLKSGLGAVAEHLPEALQLENWRGFNNAVREGFIGQRTGTEGASSPRRPPHLGLVSPGSGEN